MDAKSMQLKAEIQFHQNSDGSISLKSMGDWTIGAIKNVANKLDIFANAYRNIPVEWDVADISEIDSAGMMLFIHCYDLLSANNCTIEVIGATEKHKQLYSLLRDHVEAEIPIAGRRLGQKLLKPFYLLGKWVTEFVTEVIAFLSFLGESTLVFLKSLRHPASIRYGAIIKNVEEAGVRALPIVALTSFLIGVVITYQGAVQLEKFGANIFIVDMISISVTRELAPLITAIVVAGRTGSSYTAQLGVMKITEEMDAMRTMGFDPHHFLVIPRIFALMIALPLLVFFADIVGIFAGMLISQIHLQLSFTEFLNRLPEVLDVKHVWIGIIKAPFFAWLIATVSCFRGFQVEKTTESIGRYTTISVVNAIFLVIACDAIFSVILTEMGI